MKKTSGFTLIETIIVITIVAILLGAVMALSFDYVSTMRVKTDKEQMANIMTDAMAVARTSNYYDSIEYDEIDITIISGAVYSRTEGSSSASISSFDLKHSEIVFSGSNNSFARVTIQPYEIGCEFQYGSSALSGGVLSFELHSQLNDDIYCYEVLSDVCKLDQIVCP